MLTCDACHHRVDQVRDPKIKAGDRCCTPSDCCGHYRKEFNPNTGHATDHATESIKLYPSGNASITPSEVILTIGGAQTSKLDGRFDLLPFAGLLSAARRFEMGAKKYAENQWKKGDETFAKDRVNHLVRHAILFAEHFRQEDLEAILCNGMMMAYYKSKGYLKEVESEQRRQ